MNKVDFISTFYGILYSNGDIMKNKKVYIILTYTGTILSRIIRLFTGAKYAHASISLDKNLNRMYSFGRINPYIAFWGGFVHENINWGTFKRFKNTKAIIYSIDVTQEQYNKIEESIEYFIKNKKQFHFNVLGTFLSGFKIKYKKKNKFYCSEFVKYILDEAKVETNLNDIVKPIDFLNIKQKEIIYEGLLRNYKG